jgi:hypothetical protein
MTANKDESAAIRIATYDGEETPVPFAVSHQPRRSGRAADGNARASDAVYGPRPGREARPTRGGQCHAQPARREPGRPRPRNAALNRSGTMDRMLRLTNEQYAARLAAARPAARAKPKTRRPVQPATRERDVLKAVLALLSVHPAVGWAQRMNSGVARFGHAETGERVVRFAFPGCADVIGPLRTGAWLAIETKRPGKKATPDQAAFLERVRANGGVAFVATTVDDVINHLRRATT